MANPQVAKKVDIATLLSGKYVRVEGDWQPNYIEIESKDRISRVNIIGTVISASPDSITLDDGTGRIVSRSFQASELFSSLSVGEVVLFIGRPREYAQEIYLYPEIVKRVTNPDWIRLRKIELERGKPVRLPPPDLIFSLIEGLDKGDGVDIEVIIGESRVENAEAIIKGFLKEGSIFELKPGRVKITK